jgi:DNA polymerase-1
MMSQKRLYLLDAYALIFRGYFAFIKNPRINSKGMDTSAIMGFMNALMDVIKREKPDHLAVAFDKGGSDYRYEMYQEYKAHRDETPEAIKIAVPYIQELLKAMHIPIIEKAGFEADDLIGTLAKQAEKEGFKFLWLRQIRILHNWFPKIFSCINQLEWVTILKFGEFQKC